MEISDFSASTTMKTTFNFDGSQSRCESIHAEAQEILKQKNQEIENLKLQIDEAEKQLEGLKASLEEKANNLTLTITNGKPTSGVLDHDDLNEINAIFEHCEVDVDIDFEELQRLNKEELHDVRAQYDDEIQMLKIHFSRALKDIEKWSEKHAETVYLEKKAELNNLSQKLETLRSTQIDEYFSQTQAKTQNLYNIKSRASECSNRMKELNRQLADISALSRDEVREVRAKIDECILAVEIREREHQNEVEKYQSEIEQSDAFFKEQTKTMENEFLSEKACLQQRLNTAVTKTKDLHHALKQLAKHHEAQLQTAENDLKKMKESISISQERENSTLSETKSQSSQLQAFQRELKNNQQELDMICNELRAVQDENMQLRLEIDKMDQADRLRKSKL
ncbi:hypothetical protein TRFO_39137 [Tritrichomonas foetus]|uniref:Kinetoplast-associated protein n=1 Tax=Tritrichomonas foetus TaxID=1144522 RepID=A0A1J4JB83_9EUKA|nr:hypothetical protein TRFO_39137 [Tritrichomonas foetus]|eukprot:OHS94693.1 hypothetical protein TRFO_39137 [Tritrichomonas foetus]